MTTQPDQKRFPVKRREDAPASATPSPAQLRLARSNAQRLGIEAQTDAEAIEKLRAAGHDPFERKEVLQMVQSGNTGPSQANPTPPQPQLSPRELREKEIAEVQAAVAARQKKRFRSLLLRLAVFVLIPTILVGYYFFGVATPMYATQSEFFIITADKDKASGGALAATQFGNNQDSIAVQSYLASKDAMLRLDRDLGFKAHFSQDHIDFIQRLGPDATLEDAYDLYQRKVEIAFDPTEGILRMEVVAADPIAATQFAEALIAYAEERVDALSKRKRDDTMAGAEANLAEAEAARRTAQEELVRLQQQGALLDPDGRVSSLRNQIGSLEGELQKRQLELQTHLANPAPNTGRVAGLQGEIRRMEMMIAGLTQEMTASEGAEGTLAGLSTRIKLAQADLDTRDVMLKSALEQVQIARAEAAAQVRYLTTSVRPVTPEEASYPRAVADTALALLIFTGIYLMISLTVSILREQVTT